MLKSSFNALRALVDLDLMHEIEYVNELVLAAEKLPRKEFESFLKENPPSPRLIYELMVCAQRQLHKENKKRASAIGKKAADARHSQRGGSHYKRDKMRESWSSGKYKTKIDCAKKECGNIGMSLSVAIKALHNQ